MGVRWANWCRFAPAALLLLEHGGILCRTVLYESLFSENCASAQEIGEKMRPSEAQSWPEFEIFIFEIWVLMRPGLVPRQLFLERIDGHETHTIRQIRACSI